MQFKTSHSRGVAHHQPTVTIQDDANAHPSKGISGVSGDLEIVQAAGNNTLTSSALNWKEVPIVGTEIFISGFTNAGNNGRFIVSSVTGNTIVMAAPSGVNETISSALNLIKLYFPIQKVFQDVAFSSGIPNYNKVATSSTCTVQALGGVFSYISANNTTDVDAIITIAGGELIVPAGGSMAHEVRPFANDISGVASGATTGNLYINIS